MVLDQHGESCSVSTLSILRMPSACVTVIITSHYFIKDGAGIWCHCHATDCWVTTLWQSRNLRGKKKSTIFIGTDSFCIDDLFYYEHALTSVPVYFYKQPHLQSMDADMSRIRVGDDMDFLSFIYSVLWTDIYKKGYFKCVNSAVNVELSEFKSIYTHSWHCI